MYLDFNQKLYDILGITDNMKVKLYDVIQIKFLMFSCV